MSEYGRCVECPQQQALTAKWSELEGESTLVAGSPKSLVLYRLGGKLPVGGGARRPARDDWFIRIGSASSRATQAKESQQEKHCARRLGNNQSIDGHLCKCEITVGGVETGSVPTG